MAAPPPPPPPPLPLLSTTNQTVLTLILILILLINITASPVLGANWCVARSDASNQALQTALDYACVSGADCTPIQSDGLCFLPNTILAHASYAFNSYFQRKSMAPGSCDFSGTATVARTDPSYGSCVYPSSLSTAGGTTTGTTPSTSTNPNILAPPTTVPTNGGGVPGLNPTGTTPMLPGPEDSKAATLGFKDSTVLVPVITLLMVPLLAI